MWPVILHSRHPETCSRSLEPAPLPQTIVVRREGGRGGLGRSRLLHESAALSVPSELLVGEVLGGEWFGGVRLVYDTMHTDRFLGRGLTGPGPPFFYQLCAH